ncbi:chb [Symbiodinium sp. CCMP2592]|nr:chb [Symbiodinium sp. CCMP2592]
MTLRSTNVATAKLKAFVLARRCRRTSTCFARHFEGSDRSAVAALGEDFWCAGESKASGVPGCFVITGVAQILEHLDVIVAPIVAAAETDAAEMRKAAIFSLVDLYLIVGEDVMSYFRQELSPSQLRLVTLYAERQQCDSRGATVEDD